MHTYALLTEQDDLDKHLLPVLQSNGSEIPAPGCYVAAVEFDEAGAVVGYQMLQTALCAEGMWARDNSAHFLKLWHMAMDYAKETLKAPTLMTFTKKDETGERIGNLVEHIRFQKLDLNVYRRQF